MEPLIKEHEHEIKTALLQCRMRLERVINTIEKLEHAWKTNKGDDDIS